VVCKTQSHTCGILVALHRLHRCHFSMYLSRVLIFLRWPGSWSWIWFKLVYLVALLFSYWIITLTYYWFFLIISYFARIWAIQFQSCIYTGYWGLKDQNINCWVLYSKLSGDRILGRSSTVCINPSLQKGHWNRSNPVRRKTRSCLLSLIFVSGFLTASGLTRSFCLLLNIP
jgi:hypothetical protein